MNWLNCPCASIVWMALLTIGGCAAGRTDDGSILIGAKVAELPETMEQAAKFAAGALPEPWGTLAKAAIGLVFGGSAAALAARRAKQREDQAWDEAEARAYGRHNRSIQPRLRDASDAMK
jgi:hypothetical protein